MRISADFTFTLNEILRDQGEHNVFADKTKTFDNLVFTSVRRFLPSASINSTFRTYKQGDEVSMTLVAVRVSEFIMVSMHFKPTKEMDAVVSVQWNVVVTGGDSARSFVEKSARDIGIPLNETFDMKGPRSPKVACNKIKSRVSKWCKALADMAFCVDAFESLEPPGAPDDSSNYYIPYQPGKSFLPMIGKGVAKIPAPTIIRNIGHLREVFRNPQAFGNQQAIALPQAPTERKIKWKK